MFHNRLNLTAAEPCIPYVPGLTADSVSGSSAVLNPYFGKSVRQSADTLQSISTKRLNFDQKYANQNKNASSSSSGYYADLSS